MQIETVYNDEDVRTVTDAELEMLQWVMDRYVSMEKEVCIFQTIHGMIAHFRKLPGRFIPGTEDQPARLDMEDFAFFQTLGARWVEASNGSIKVGF